MIRSQIFALIIALLPQASLAQAQQQKPIAKSTPQTAVQEMKRTLGSVPLMFNLLPSAAVPGAWEEFKTVQMATDTAIPNKYKELIGAAVAAQIPCRYCAYFHRRAAMDLNQASQLEFREAVAESALTRHWSTVLNGLQQDEDSFRRDVERMFKKQLAAPPQAETSSPSGSVSGTTSAAEPEARSEIKVAKTPDDVYSEAKRIWGFVPTFVRSFPKVGIVGAWNEYVALEMNPKSAIPMKYKSLISLAVASQIPCGYCVLMDKRAAQAAGATEAEINEAIAVSSIVRHWSTVLNGNLVSESEFRQSTDRIISFVKAQKPETETGTTSSTTSP